MIKVIIAGGREFDDYELVKKTLDEHFYYDGPSIIEIVSGGAKGADALGEKYAKEFEYTVKIFPAKWEVHGKSAGPKRNTQMANYADILIAFWDGQSKGTRHMINVAKSNDLRLTVVRY